MSRALFGVLVGGCALVLTLEARDVAGALDASPFVDATHDVLDVSSVLVERPEEVAAVTLPIDG